MMAGEDLGHSASLYASSPRGAIEQATARQTSEVVGDVQCLPLSIVNCFFVGDSQAVAPDWVLVDAALWNSADSILRAAEQRFGPHCPPKAIVLTHGHFDHVGALETLLNHWNVPVHAHPLEFPYLTGASSYPPPDPAVGGGGMTYLSFLYPRGPINLGTRLSPLPSDGSVPYLPGWQAIHTPGHTAGHVSLWRESDRTLIAGDAFVTTQQETIIAALTKPQRVCRPPAYYTSDWQAARASVERLAALNPRVVATGHGVPMRGEAMLAELHHLADNFSREIPAWGRYAHQPAVANEHGVVSIPPAVISPQLIGLAGAAAGLLLGTVLFSRRRG